MALGPTALKALAAAVAAAIAGLGGVIYCSRLRSISTSFGGDTIVLCVVATAVIGQASLFDAQASI